MKTFSQYINEGYQYRFSIPHDKVKRYKYFPSTKGDLIQAIEAEIEEQGPNANLNCIDTSEITDMSNLFNASKYEYAKTFNGDISGWNVSNVKNMEYMFDGARNFNGDISEWDVSNVTNMDSMFWYAISFNQDISKWNISNVMDMGCMFCHAESFNQDISNWDIHNVWNMENIFLGAKCFNRDISNWNISDVENTYNMFYKCPIKEEYKPKFN